MFNLYHIHLRLIFLDTIIKEINSSSVATITDGTEGTDYNLGIIQSQTEVFDPINSGTYNIDVNGQTLTVEVTDPSVIPIDDIVNFEDGSLHQSFGSTSDWAVESSEPELTGNYTLHHKVDVPETIVSTDETIRYVKRDERSACYVYEPIGGQSGSKTTGLAFAVQDTNNFYYVLHIPTTGIRVGKLKSGSRSSNSKSISTNFSTWYDLEFEWLSNGDITARIFEVDSTGKRTSSSLGSVTYNDTEWSSGGIGFCSFAGDGNPNYDNWRILENLS